MRTHFVTFTTILGALFCVTLCFGQSPLPSTDLTAIIARIQRDFRSVDQIRTIGMTDNPGGRFDVVVIGERHGAWGGWRVEVLSVEHHQLKERWDSVQSAKEPEFENSGPLAVNVNVRDYDYDVLISGCLAHNCGDGVDGFLFFSGRTGKTYKAKVVTQGLDKPVTGAPKYGVTFSNGITDDARRILEGEICRSSAISNKPGLPFECKNP